MTAPSNQYGAARATLTAAHRDQQRREAVIDELLLCLRDALRLQRLDGFELTFAKSLMRQSRRRGWQPTEKQRRLIDSIVAGLRAEADPLVDRDDIGGADAA